MTSCARPELQANLWTFATKKAALRPIDINTMLLSASLWSQSTTYYRGSIVTDENGNYWVSKIPEQSQQRSAADQFLGAVFRHALCPAIMTTTGAYTSYFAGELVLHYAGRRQYTIECLRLLDQRQFR